MRLWGILILGLCPLVFAEAEKPSAAQIRKWVDELGDDTFATRHEAWRKLILSGDAAVGPLQAVLPIMLKQRRGVVLNTSDCPTSSHLSHSQTRHG